ncbi:hypothetical protein EDD39_1253 [Kitasatospora cineracea]|uniref:Uncharacterized protein n=2 Tax=Kitasatospora cineracea TaxID=88074 RepID=A0A8G1UK05_9ACTN|nr:hypothetical protein EDD39_1253 [Kitasatospora cineracea]
MGERGLTEVTSVPSRIRSAAVEHPRAAWIPQHVCCVAATTRITVTLPTEQMAELKKLTDNVSGYGAEAVARQLRLQLLAEDLRQ